MRFSRGLSVLRAAVEDVLGTPAGHGASERVIWLKAYADVNTEASKITKFPI